MSLTVTRRAGICRIEFGRPEAYHALDEASARALVDAMTAAGADDEVRVVVVTGSGPAFCAGAELSGPDPLDGFGPDTMAGAAQIIRVVTGLGKPVVAAVNGVAAGVGASLCFAADLCVATESATFLLAFTRLGLMPDGGATATVAAAAGRARAMRWSLLAEPLTAAEAHAAGLVSHVAGDDEFAAVVDKVVGRLAAGPTTAYAATKKAVNAATLGGLEEALDREARGQLVLFGTDDAREGTRAFVEGRRAVFTGH